MRLPGVRTLLVFAAALGWPIGAPSAPAAPAVPERPSLAAPADGERLRLERLAEEIGVLIDTIAASPQIAGVAAVVVKDDRLLLAKGAGVTDFKTRQAVDADTVFRLASLSKGFAATVAAQLVREGALRWDMPIQPWLPGFHLASADDTQRVTLLDVLSHRVGLPYNTLDRRLEADEPYPILVEALQNVPLRCPVGDCFGYQNIAFSLVGDLVFACTGDFYSFQVEKRLFEPLGMRTATYGRDALEGSGNWARPHVRRKNVLSQVSPKDTYYRVAPAAGINASVTDLGQWLIAQMGGRPDVLPPELLAELHAPRIDTPYEIRGTGWRQQRLRSAAYGLGWRVMDYAGERLIFHAGAVQGYRAMLGFLPDRGFGIAILWNSETGLPAGLMPVALDRFLQLPDTDWMDLDELGLRAAATHASP